MYQNRIKEIDILKKEIDSYRPLKKRELNEIKEYFRIGLTYSSNALEGNTLTETETKILLEDGLTVGGKSIKDYFEAIGHSKAYDLLFKIAKKEEITEADILKLHKLFYYIIDSKNAGKYRKSQVFITGTEFVPAKAKDIPVLMKQFIKNLKIWKNEYHIVEFAAIAHKEFVTIHPFIDGNGRCARLLMNLILLQHGYCITIIPPITRVDYINGLKKAQLKNNNQDFVNFISNMVYENMKEYLRLIKALL